jgi:hypothetical protein
MHPEDFQGDLAKNARLCVICGSRPVYRYNAKQCQLCKHSDRNRNRNRRLKTPEMFVSCDGEGVQKARTMAFVSFSYGREDGTATSFKKYGATGFEVAQWFFDEGLDGVYTDADGQQWKQALVGFHMGWDTGLIVKSFVEDLDNCLLILKATARKEARGQLCWTEHDNIIECTKMHRNDRETKLKWVSEAENDFILLHKPTGLALGFSKKRRLYLELRPAALKGQFDRMEGNRRIDIHDTGSAFVGGLEMALDTWKPQINTDQRDIIAWGKQHRKDGSFVQTNLSKVAAYSEAECVSHARMCRQLLDALHHGLGLVMTPSALFGSGSVAAAALKFHGMPTSDQIHTDTRFLRGGGIDEPIRIDDVAFKVYFGGEIQAPVIGLIKGEIDTVDINSAYPDKIRKLPCMRINHGHWDKVVDECEIQADDLGYVWATWAVDTSTVAPFPFRLRDGGVRTPLVGSHWVSIPEYVAAREQFPGDTYFTRGVRWVQDCGCEPPFQWIADYYTARQDIKAQMSDMEALGLTGSDEYSTLDGQQLAIKLVINSIYGKLAQTRPKLGQFTNLHAAAWITGMTRAQLRRKAWEREAEGGIIVAMHTDSIISQGGNPTDEGPALGDWGLEKAQVDMIAVQPGLRYATVPAKNKTKTASRGCGADEFKIAATDWVEKVDLTRHPREWGCLDTTEDHMHSPEGCGALVIPRKMMITWGLARVRNKFEELSAFVDMPLNINFNSPKRDVDAARLMPGQTTAWMVPPPTATAAPATLAEIKAYRALVLADEINDLHELPPEERDEIIVPE